jgi:CHAT domain-containing protein
MELAVLSQLHNRGEHEKALAAAAAALNAIELPPGDDATIVAAARASIAAFGVNAALELERYEEALHLAELEIAAAQRTTDATPQARGLMHRALALEGQGRLDAAAADYLEASRILERVPPEDGQAEELRRKLAFNRGDLMVNRGQSKAGLEALMASTLTAADDADGGEGREREEVLRLNNLGQVALQLGQAQEAREVLERAYSVALASGWSRAIGIVACNLGMAHLALGDQEQAIRYLIEARDIHRKANVLEPLARDCYNLGLIYHLLNRRQDALTHYQEAWQAIRQVAPHSLLALSILYGLALERFVQHDFKRARAILRRGLELYEQIRPDVGRQEAEQQGAMEQYRLLLELHLGLSLHQGWRDEALELIERGKARYWAETVASLRPPDATSDGEAGASRLAPGHLFRQLPNVIGPRALLLDFFVGDNFTFVAYGSGGSLAVHRVDVMEAELREMVEQANHELLASPSRQGRSEMEGRRLAELLLRDVDFGVDRLRMVFVLPDGPLWELPFDALPVRSGGHLVDLAPVVVNPALHLLAELRRQKSPDAPLEQWRVLAVGQPDAGPSAVAIPGTAEQIQEMRGLLGAASASTYLSGRDATKAKVLGVLEQATHVHIASHAFGSTENERPYILLSDGRGGPDVLYADELKDVHLQAELVFLSACSTSLGQASEGEGLLSLARAFLLSGARCVVGTLWPIGDAAAVELIRCFYERLASGTPVADALHHARAAVRAQGAPPRTWAALQLLGDGTAREDPIGIILATEGG